MELRWKASFSASCLHAAACLGEGLPIANQRIAAVLQPAVDQLFDELQAGSLSGAAALPLLIDLAADYENNRQLAEVAVRKQSGTSSSATVLRLAGAIADLEAAWLREQPQLVDELAVRGRPLREQWEARGPGLLRAITRLTVENFVAPVAEVVLVSPLVGGHGRAHLRSNRVTFEAVLTHPHPALPETLRLGWLLAQLNLDVPMFHEPVAQRRLPRLAGLATLPLVLAAAETVELAVCDEAMLTQAISCWHLAGALPDNAASQLLDWWQAYAESDTRWPVALAALDQMLQSPKS